jgi:hypothetical protein
VALRLVVVDSLLSKSPTSFQLNHSSGDFKNQTLISFSPGFNRPLMLLQPFQPMTIFLSLPVKAAAQSFKISPEPSQEEISPPVRAAVQHYLAGSRLFGVEWY